MVLTYRPFMFEQNTMNSPFLHKVTAWNKPTRDTILAKKIDMFKQNIATINHVMHY